MKPILLLLITAACALIARIIFVQLGHPVAFTPRPDTTLLTPPTEAYQGTIKTLEGIVKKFARNADDFTPLDKTQPIFQGEIIATEDGATATIALGKKDDILMEIHENSEVEFVHLVYPDVLFRHRRGIGSYTTTMSSFSIRSLRALVHVAAGAVSINTRDDTVTLTLQSGAASLAVVDAENETHVWNLKPGDRAVVTETETFVYKR